MKQKKNHKPSKEQQFIEEKLKSFRKDKAIQGIQKLLRAAEILSVSATKAHGSELVMEYIESWIARSLQDAFEQGKKEGGSQ